MRIRVGLAWTALLLASPIAISATTETVAQAADEPTADPAAVEKVKQFLSICLETPDLNEAGKKVVAAGLVHRSWLDPSGSQLKGDALRFSFKKAHGNAKFYDPSKVTRIVKTTTSGVGFGPTAQKGSLYKYWIAKKDGAGGLPAPVQIFVPDGGGGPVLYDWGSF